MKSAVKVNLDHNSRRVAIETKQTEPAEVTAEARRYCEVLGANGGYILAPTHLFQPDVPPENVVSVYQ